MTHQSTHTARSTVSEKSGREAETISRHSDGRQIGHQGEAHPILHHWPPAPLPNAHKTSAVGEPATGGPAADVVQRVIHKPNGTPYKRVAAASWYRELTDSQRGKVNTMHTEQAIYTHKQVLDRLVNAWETHPGSRTTPAIEMTIPKSGQVKQANASISGRTL